MVENDGCTALDFLQKNGSYKLITCFANMGSDIHLNKFSYCSTTWVFKSSQDP